VRIDVKSRITPEKKRRNRDARKDRHAALVADIKSKTPCTDCKRKFPYWVMDFDHVGTKDFQISRLHRTKGLEALSEEIKKCDVLCSTCHRHRTYCRQKGVELYVLDVVMT
jgi:hypothetical protein